MKKLNKKGFTLVELLAVIVILAVIMVITIPTVLGSMSDATDSAAQSAIAAIQKYIDDQTQLCNAGLGTLAEPAEIFSGTTCNVDSGKVNLILSNSGYDSEFDAINFDTTNSKFGSNKTIAVK